MSDNAPVSPTPGELERILRDLVWRQTEASQTAESVRALLGPLRERAQEPLRSWAASLSSALEEGDEARMAILAAQGLRLLAERAHEPQTPEPGLPGDELLALRGCGPATARHLRSAGLSTLRDLAFFLPRSYEDLRTSRPLAEIREGYSGLLAGQVTHSTWAGPPGRRHFEAHIRDESGGRVVAVWFQVPRGLPARLEPGANIRLSGKVYRFRNRLQVAHPRFVPKGETGVLPVYPRIRGVGNTRIHSLCRQAAQRIPEDGLPDTLLEELELPSLKEALLFLHAPPPDVSDEELAQLQAGRHRAQRRLLLSEIFLGQLALAQRRARARANSAPVCPAPGDWTALLPLHPTGAQIRVIQEISQDLASGRPMLRLLQGEVGSGKTLVAFAAALQVTSAGYKVALMAPTEILAAQQAAVLENWFQGRVPVVFLSASTPAPVRRTAQAVLAGPGPAVAVGTHALLAPSLRIERLGLVVIDEQHRFGVLQRYRLTSKSESQPHLLVMTATPIPRTMALALHGDLDLSILDELPAGRPRVETRLFEHGQRKEAWALLRDLLAQGLQCYVVCPRREETGREDLQDAERTARRIAAYCPATGLLHGKMSASEKESALADFRAGRLQVLVSTTVVEVGVDVPTAAVMVVLNAERFGLAQLHQLRGRVGRGGMERAYCLLVAGPRATPQALARLRVLVETNDGFEIAERDLALRGPGELTGTRQAGRPALLQAGTRMLAAARRAARRLLDEDPDLSRPEHRVLAARLRLEGRRSIGPEAG